MAQATSLDPATDRVWQSVALTARDLYLLLVDLQDARKRPPRTLRDPPASEQAKLWTERMQAIASRARLQATDLGASHPRLAQALDHAVEAVDRLRAALAAGKPLRAAATARLAQHYEAVAGYLRAEPQRLAGVDLPVLKPRNYARNLFHIGNGLMSASLYTFIPDQTAVLWIACVYTGAMVSLEILRRLDKRINAFLVNFVFRAIARPVEAHRVNAATWYGLAIIVIVLCFPPVACITAVLVLGFGDPVAALVGKRWGRRRLRGQKTLEGTLGFVAAAAVASAVFLFLTPHPDLARLVGATDPAVLTGWILALSGIGAVTGAVTELFSDRIEDNFSIPVIVAGVLTACMSLAS